MTVREINRAILAGQWVKARYLLDGKEEEGRVRQARSTQGRLEIQTGGGRWAPVVTTVHVWVVEGLRKEGGTPC